MISLFWNGWSSSLLAFWYSPLAWSKEIESATNGICPHLVTTGNFINFQIQRNGIVQYGVIQAVVSMRPTVLKIVLLYLCQVDKKAMVRNRFYRIPNLALNTKHLNKQFIIVDPT